MTLPLIAPDQPVLIAGPTASGKSELALRIAQDQGGVIVNADALQVYDDWRILTARPSEQDEAIAPHALYGHLSGDTPYSVGAWLRDLEPFLQGRARPIIVGGTGLYFSALTQGLADIPATTPQMRATADDRLREGGLAAMVAGLDPASRARIDTANPMRVQRAWEVLQMTGRGIADWQDDTPPARLGLDRCVPILFDRPKEALNARIAARFAAMLQAGALDEAHRNLHSWSPARPSAKAIGAAELIAYVQGEMSLADAQDRATIATRQFAKRQRTWFRARMRDWHRYRPHNNPQTP